MLTVFSGAMPLSITPFIGIFEPASALTHLVASAAVLFAAPRLLRLGGSRRRIVSLGSFLGSAALLLALSGIYHSLDPSAARDLAQRFDHAAIWTLIVGTLTPILVVLLRGNLRRALMIGSWTIALAGVVLKTVFFDDVPEWVGLVFYVGLSWLGALSCVGLVKHSGWTSVALFLGGGVAYTGGAILEFARVTAIIPGVLGAHELFHIAIVIAVVLHWRLLARLMRKDVPPSSVPEAEMAWWDRRPAQGAVVE